MCMSRARAIVASVLFLAAVLVPGLAGADGTWLDGPVTNWNRPGMAIPQAPPRNSASQPQCFDSALDPNSPPRQALVDAGWSLFKAQNATGVPFEILSGQANADGMCRPTDYQLFVFESGVFAGTLSPDLMDSRTDGALVETQIQSSDVILATYQRYTPQDALCCPSSQSTATFKVDRSGPSPVVVLQSVTTEPTSAASATPTSAASATPPSTTPTTPTATRPPGAAQANCFPETDFCITNPQFADYFAERGGVRILGYPISRSFTLEGFEVQFFQRVILQMQAGQVARLNVLDPNVMPMTRANQSTFPPPDPALAAQAPPVTSPTYAQDVAEFIERVAPNTWNGMPVGFYTLFSTTVPVDVAFTGQTANPDQVTLLNLEIWGLPTSNPAADPNNGGFVYQRWQRGIMHFRAEGPVTEGILVGDYFKSVITGRNLPPDLSADMQGSRYLGQYSPRLAGLDGASRRAAEHRHDRRVRARDRRGHRANAARRQYADGHDDDNADRRYPDDVHADINAVAPQLVVAASRHTRTLAPLPVSATPYVAGSGADIRPATCAPSSTPCLALRLGYGVVRPTTAPRSLASRVARGPISMARSGSSRCCCSITRAITPVQPVWWLAPMPAPLSPWKYS